MKKSVVLVAVVAAIAFGNAANAADMPTKGPIYKAPPAVVAPYNWTGFYAGLQAGYGWFDPTYNYAPGGAVKFDTNGFVGGGTVGYNWQTGPLVLGAEGDLSYADVKGSAVFSAVFTPPCTTPTEGCSAKLSWFATGRLRVGYAIGDLMPYVTGGGAVGHIKGSADQGACGTGCGFDDTRGGWTVGGGLEYRFARSWSAKVEYLYMNLGTPSFTTAGVTTSDFAYNIVRGGVNLHF
jgi:outer membrane immunogenic protein